jgi:hypothetical protein
MRSDLKSAGLLLLIAPLVMGVSDCSNKEPQKANVKWPSGPPSGLPTLVATPTLAACPRVHFSKQVPEPCSLPGGLVGTSIWTMDCYSDSERDPASGQCKPNGQQEYCNPDPTSHTECVPAPIRQD